MEQHLQFEVVGVCLQVDTVAHLTGRQLDGHAFLQIGLVRRVGNEHIGLDRFRGDDIEASTLSEGHTFDIAYDVALDPGIGSSTLLQGLGNREGFILRAVTASVTALGGLAFLDLEVLHLPGGRATGGSLEPEADAHMFLAHHCFGQLDLARGIGVEARGGGGSGLEVHLDPPALLDVLGIEGGCGKDLVALLPVADIVGVLDEVLEGQLGLLDVGEVELGRHEPAFYGTVGLLVGSVPLLVTGGLDIGRSEAPGLVGCDAEDLPPAVHVGGLIGQCAVIAFWLFGHGVWLGYIRTCHE